MNDMKVTNLAFRTWGVRDKPPLVLLHGFLGDSEDWAAFSRELETEFYLVAVDLPGHGKSKDISIEQGRAFQDFSELLTATLDQLGLERYSLMGYSLGGRLAMWHMTETPDVIDKLIVESSHPGLEDETEREDRWRNDQVWAEQFRSESLEEVLQRWYHQPVFADLNSQARERLMKHRSAANVAGTGLADVLEAFSLARQPELWGLLECMAGTEKATCTSHYLYGDRDLKFQAIAHRLLELGCFQSVHKVKGAGHNIHREQPQSMAQVIRRLFS